MGGMTLVAAIRRAIEVRARLGIRGVATPRDAERALAEAGLVRWPDARMPDGLYGTYYRNVVRVRTGLRPGTALFVVAHEMGHAAMGHGKSAYRAPLIGGGPEATDAEAEAQVWAFVFLLGEPARTHAGLNAQLHAGHAVDLPLGFLFGCASLFGQALASA